MAKAERQAGGKARVLIVDDEPLARKFLHRLLTRSGFAGEIRQCANGLAAKAEITRTPPDILFLDVEMPGLSGADLLESLPAGRAPVTIFTTAYSEHAVRAFELEACDYLLKPFDEARFDKALKRAMATLAKSRAETAGTRLSVQDGRRTVLIDPGDILMVSSEDNYIRIAVEGRVFLQRATLAAIEATLANANFLRVHRRVLVNMAHVREIADDRRGLELVLSDGSRAPVSRRLKDRVKACTATS
jgi:two-component system LytT family response regulator